jgi:hypothetical protein
MTSRAPGCTGTSGPQAAREFLAFLRYLRTLYPPGCGWGSRWTTSVRTCPPGPTAGSPTGQRQIVELADVPANASWPNRIDAQFQALRYFTFDDTDASHHEQAA